MIWLIIAVIIVVIVILISETKENFYDTNKYTDLAVFENNFMKIYNEIPVFDINKISVERDRDSWNNSDGEALANSLKSEWIKGWQTDWYNFPLIYHGKLIDKANALCPFTSSLLAMAPFINIAGFSLLLPHSALSPHTDEAGVKNNSLAANLLLTDSDAELIVSGERKKHIRGKMIVFNSNLEHYATNNSDKIRVILYIEFKTNYIYGYPVKGIGLGKKLDYPTINVEIPNYHKCGVYKGTSVLGDVTVFIRKKIAECHYTNYTSVVEQYPIFIWNLKYIQVEKGSILSYFANNC